MYDEIVPWWTSVADGRPPADAGPVTARDREFAALLRELTTIVVSRTLEHRPAERR